MFNLLLSLIHANNLPFTLQGAPDFSSGSISGILLIPKHPIETAQLSGDQKRIVSRYGQSKPVFLSTTRIIIRLKLQIF